MEFIFVAEIWAKISRPLISLCQKHSPRELPIDFSPQLLQDVVGLRQVLTICALPFHQVRNRVEPEGIHTHLQPKPHHIPHLLPNGRIVVVQIGLMTKEAMPIVGFRNRVPSPVRRFCVEKNDSCSLVPRLGITPDVPITPWIVPRASRLLKPRVLIGCVI